MELEKQRRLFYFSLFLTVSLFLWLGIYATNKKMDAVMKKLGVKPLNEK